MNIFTEFRHRVVKAVEALGVEAKDGGALDFSKLGIEPPRDASHGDIATNAALVLAKQAGMPPRELAEKIAEKLGEDSDVETSGIAGPGFVNLKLSNGFWRKQLATILAQEAGYGSSDLGGGRKINVEYVSANPTGPMHVGHCRGAVFGDALASLLSFVGYDVTREYYINDAGAQVDVLARSAYLRYREALGEPIGEIPEGLYPGEYLKEVGGELAAGGPAQEHDGVQRHGREPEAQAVQHHEQPLDAALDAGLLLDLLHRHLGR